MKIIRFLSVTILLVFCIATMAVQSYADEFKGYPITEQNEEELSAFLGYHEWKSLSVDTEKAASIDAFAVSDESLCAIAIDSKIFVYKEDTVAACYYYETSGTFNLLFDGRKLVIHEVRGERLLFIDCDTGTMSLFDLEMEKFSSEQHMNFYKFGVNPRNGIVDGNGYYVTNQWQWMDGFTNSHEKLIFVQDGQEILLHESFTHLIWISLFAGSSVIAGLLLLFKLREYRQSKRDAQGETE